MTFLLYLSPGHPSQEVSDDEDNDERPAKKARTLEDEFGIDIQSDQSVPEYVPVNAAQEVANYLAAQVSNEDAKADVLEFWKANQKRWPRLAKIAFKLSVIQVGDELYEVTNRYWRQS